MSSITHRYRSHKPDAPNHSLVRPSDWNDYHLISYQINVVTGARVDGTQGIM